MSGVSEAEYSYPSFLTNGEKRDYIACVHQRANNQRKDTYNSELVQKTADTLVFPPNCRRRGQVGRNAVPHQIFNTVNQSFKPQENMYSHSCSFRKALTRLSALLRGSKAAFDRANASKIKPMRSSTPNTESGLATSVAILDKRVSS